MRVRKKKEVKMKQKEIWTIVGISLVVAVLSSVITTSVISDNVLFTPPKYDRVVSVEDVSGPAGGNPPGPTCTEVECMSIDNVRIEGNSVYATGDLILDSSSGLVGVEGDLEVTGTMSAQNIDATNIQADDLDVEGTAHFKENVLIQNQDSGNPTVLKTDSGSRFSVNMYSSNGLASALIVAPSNPLSNMGLPMVAINDLVLDRVWFEDVSGGAQPGTRVYLCADVIDVEDHNDDAAKLVLSTTPCV